MSIFSPNKASAFKPFSTNEILPSCEGLHYHSHIEPLFSMISFQDFLEKKELKEQIDSMRNPQEMEQEKDDNSSTDSYENIIIHDQTSGSQIQIGEKLDAPKKRKNKEETKQEIQEKKKDEGRGGNCIASNITKTLIRVTQNRLQTKLRLEFKALIEKYKIKSQKENTIIILLILYDMVITEQLSFSIFENIFAFFMKSLHESKENCQKKMADEPERKGFHLKNKKMYVNFININREIYSKLVEALRSNGTVQMDLQFISDIISDTYDRKQRQIQKALSKLKSIILNHGSLKALFGHEKNDIISTLFEAIDYAYRRNLDKRRNQAKKRVEKFIKEVLKNVFSEEEEFFMCFCALKLVGEKEEEIWEEFVKSTNLKREYNQTEEQALKLQYFLSKEIPVIFSQFVEKKPEAPMTIEDEVKIEEESQASQKVPQLDEIFRGFVRAKEEEC